MSYLNILNIISYPLPSPEQGGYVYHRKVSKKEEAVAAAQRYARDEEAGTPPGPENTSTRRASLTQRIRASLSAAATSLVSEKNTEPASPSSANPLHVPDEW